MEERQLIFICSVLGTVVFFAFIYWLIKPRKWVYAALILVVLLALYAIQPVTWEEEENTTILGYTVYSERALYSQITLFGAVPVGNVIELKRKKAVLEETEPLASLTVSTAVSFLPGAGIMRLWRLFQKLFGKPVFASGERVVQTLADSSPGLIGFFLSYFRSGEEQQVDQEPAQAGQKTADSLPAE